MNVWLLGQGRGVGTPRGRPKVGTHTACVWYCDPFPSALPVQHCYRPSAPTPPPPHFYACITTSYWPPLPPSLLKIDQRMFPILSSCLLQLRLLPPCFRCEDVVPSTPPSTAVSVCGFSVSLKTETPSQMKTGQIVLHCVLRHWCSELVSWCFEPSQPQRITSGLDIDIGYPLRQITGTLKYSFYFCKLFCFVLSGRLLFTTKGSLCPD